MNAEDEDEIRDAIQAYMLAQARKPYRPRKQNRKPDADQQKADNDGGVS